MQQSSRLRVISTASPNPGAAARPDAAAFGRRSVLRAGAFAGAALALAGCSATGALNGLVSSSGYAMESGVAYGPLPRQQLDIYRPQAKAQATPPGAPVVVFFYGGTWTTGERAQFRFVGEALASRGAVVVIPDYRLSPEVRYPVFVQDSAAAVKWTLDHLAQLGGDPSRVYVMGHSSGGYNAAMVALDNRWLSAVGARTEQLAGWIGMAGPYDFLPIDNPDAQVAFQWPNTPRDSQPIEHVSPRAPRTLLIAARSDRVVNPLKNTARLAERLQAAGVDVTLHWHERLSHVTLVGALATPLRGLAPVRDEVTDFLGLPR